MALAYDPGLHKLAFALGYIWLLYFTGTRFADFTCANALRALAEKRKSNPWPLTHMFNMGLMFATALFILVIVHIH